MKEEITREELKSIFGEACELAYEWSGIDFEVSDFVEIENGFQGKIDFRMVWKGGYPTKIKLDITKLENESILLPPKLMPLMIVNEELHKKSIPCYDLREILAEKVRSLFQRTRPRDLYDVWYLSGIIDLRSIEKMMEVKFKFKSVEMNIDIFFLKEEKFRRAWINSLKHQMRDVPDFDSVFNDVTEELEKVAL